MNEMLRYFSNLATVAKIQAALITLALFFGLYLEYFEGLAPCSLCMLQRYLFLSALLLAISIAYLEKLKYFFVTLNLISLFLGIVISAKQVRLQYKPGPNSFECGGELSVEQESFSFSKILEILSDSNHNCGEILWSFLGISIAGWALVIFVFLIILNIYAIFQLKMSTSKII